ncbi:patatin-like phospholipase family protein [Nitrospirillum sp. BR 11163]|uniref:patatin-like phospholipase family protein n=1 Tax=Nitrospirillum sp. BR 11163 TaxID=3104323 RepID=UPI002AFE8BA0|nr:patatin-like phospholipase family protein [Nitrospirillum sp. BR 11163]MEA1673234.1 patatin-like phospholipase family protein [Nitrospirillum sp. BR 11163]
MDRQADATILVLGGGNALGAYHGGAYEALAEAGVQPDWIVGASIGAVTGALIPGNPAELRLPRLRRYWELASAVSPPWLAAAGRDDYNEAHTLGTLVMGRPGFFTRRFPGLLTLLPGLPDDTALMDHHPLAATLEGLLDYGLLNGGGIRLTVGCLDVVTGEEVYFDSAAEPITGGHLLASTAAMPLFPPVDLGGRLLCDPVHRNNMPLDVPVLEMPEGRLLCFASELFSIDGPPPADMAATLARCQDLQCAGHAQRALAALRREYALRRRAGLPGGLTLVHATHRAPAHEKVGKSLNFSAQSIAERWRAGLEDMRAALGQWRSTPAGEGFTHIAPSRPGRDGAGRPS